MKINSVHVHMNFKELRAVLVLGDLNICLHAFYILFFCSFSFVLRDKVSLSSRDGSWTHLPSAPAFRNLWFPVCITTSSFTLIVFSCVSTLKYRPVSEQYSLGWMFWWKCLLWARISWKGIRWNTGEAPVDLDLLQWIQVSGSSIVRDTLGDNMTEP